MDNSQSSDFFDDAPNLPVDLPTESFSANEHISYEAILATIKEAFSGYRDEINKSGFPTYFAKLLNNCWKCIPHSLEDKIGGLLSDTTAPIDKIVGYLEDVIFLLQMLTELCRSIIELVHISCCTMTTFPTQTGWIIVSVFEHCRDSESLYGHNLKSVEKQLKDLFRICHELQLTYLLILEKHYVFDLTKVEEKKVLVEALKINLNIGKIAQSLDVKTMAEQWKANTAICEKYSTDLYSTDIYQECSQILCTLIKDNIGTAIEKSQEDKIIVRSLKIASFTLKILLKICNIFRKSNNKDFNSAVELLQYIYLTMNNVQCLETSSEKSLASLMNSTVVIPAECLLKETLLDEQFLNTLLNFVSLNSDEQNDEMQLGLVLLIASAMKCTLQNKKYQSNLKTKLISCVYSLFPAHSHILFRHQVKSGTSTYNVFEHLVVTTTALALTMTNEEFNVLEKKMIESILSTECISALFSFNLWVVLARHISPQLLFNQLIWLCNMYKKLDLHEGFAKSPQDIHLSITISRLFSTLDDEDRLKICKQFRVHDEDNITLWTAIRIRNLPIESQGKADEAIANKLRHIYSQLRESDSANLLINITNLAATCTFKTTRGIDDLLVSSWLKACQENRPLVLGLDTNTIWFYDYVKALVALTESMVDKLRERSDNLIKVLHVIHGLIRTGDTDMKLILANILCKLADYEFNDHKNLIDSHFTEAFMSLFQNSDEIVQSTLFRTLRSLQSNYLESLLSNIVRENYSLQEAWQNFGKYDIKLSSDFQYTHKCLENKHVSNLKHLEANTEMPTITVEELKEANLDDFFDSCGSEMNGVEEPACKRGKSNAYEVDSIIRSLEENVSLLVKQTVTPEQLVRIRNVCEKLNNIS